MVAGGASRKQLLTAVTPLAEPGDVAMEDSVDDRHAKLSKANKTLLDFALASLTSALSRQRMVFRPSRSSGER
jgi:hypothetical protein